MKNGFQLSSITSYLQDENNLRKAFGKIAAIGYKTVQLQGASYSIGDEVIADALRQNGLECAAIQQDYPFCVPAERVMERAVACGCKYFTFALWPVKIDGLADLERVAQEFSKINGKAREAGLVLSFHPIGPDFAPLDGVPRYERLMSMLPENVQLTFCAASCADTGITPFEVLEKFAGRVDLVHFKDWVRLPDGSKKLVPLGEGSTQWGPIADACREAGVQYIFAEQERWNRDPFDCAAASFRHLVLLEKDKEMGCSPDL